MAQELTASVSLRYSKNGASLLQNLTKVADVTGNQALNNIQSIGTSTEAIVLGDSALGYMLFQNLDSTNYVDLAIDNADASPIAKLLPGDITLIKASAATYYAKANTGACDLMVMVVDL